MKIQKRQGKEVVTQTGDVFQSNLWDLADYGSAAPLFDANPCNLCGLPARPWENGLHQHCVVAEKARIHAAENPNG